MNDSKERIMVEGFKLFLQNSYKEVTIQDIVNKVGMTKGAFYYFFESKEQLFREIFQRFFLSEVKIDFSKFSHDSLYEFYHDYYNHINNGGSSSGQDNEESGSYINYNAFIYEALKLFPDFGAEARETQLSELKAWEAVVHNAKNKGEIKSTMNDEEIASIFIYISNGVGMQSAIDGKPEEGKTKILEFWNAFYKSLKT